MSTVKVPGADIKINCTDETYYYCKFYLCRIEYFNKLLNNKFKESDVEEIDLQYPGEVFKKLVVFIEIGSINVNSPHIEDCYEFSLAIAYTSMSSYIITHIKTYSIRIWDLALSHNDPHFNGGASMSVPDGKYLFELHKLFIEKHKDKKYIIENIINYYHRINNFDKEHITYAFKNGEKFMIDMCIKKNTLPEVKDINVESLIYVTLRSTINVSRNNKIIKTFIKWYETYKDDTELVKKYLEVNKEALIRYKLYDTTIKLINDEKFHSTVKNILF